MPILVENPPVHLMVAAYLEVSKPVEPKMPPGFPVMPPAEKPVKTEDAFATFGELGHAGSGTIDADIYQGFAVKEMPLSFDDLKALNGL